MYVVTGATGNTGRVVTEKLLAAGKPVRVVGRDAGKLQAFVHQGALAVVGNLDDRDTLRRAFEGAQAVYAMIPPDYTAADYPAAQQRVGEAIVDAVRTTGVPYVLNLSSVGAQNRVGSGPVSGLGMQEDRLNALPGTHVLHLRPGMFMENLYGFLEMIRGGFIAAAMKPDIAMPWIATRDIGEVAADMLLGLDFRGKSIRELHGPRDLSWNDVVRILSKALEKPDLKYMQVSYENAAQGLQQAGISASVAQGFVDMYRSMNEGRMRPVESRSDRTTTPTTLEAFAKGLAAALG